MELLSALRIAVAVYEAVDDGEDFVFVDTNAYMRAFEGVEREALIGQRLTQVFPGVGAMGLLEVLRRVNDSGRPATLPASYYDEGDHPGWRENDVIPVGPGKVAAVYRVIGDQGTMRTMQAEVADRYERLVAAAGIGIWDWGVKQGTLFLAPGWKRQVGYEDQELPNAFETWQSRIHPEDAGVVDRALAYVQNPVGDWHAEFRLRHRDGHYLWVLAYGIGFAGPDGTLDRVFGVHIDISAQKAAERAREQAHAKLALYEKTVNASVDLLAVVDLDCRYRLVNDAYLAFHGGFSRDEAIGAHVSELLGQAFFDDVAGPSLRRAFAGETVRYEVDRESLRGHIRADVRYVPFRADDGAIIGASVSVRDQSRLHDALTDLRRAATVFESTVEGVILLDTDWRIVDVNQAFSEITGYPRDQALGQRAEDLVRSGVHTPEFYAELRGKVEREGAWRGEIWNRKRDGEIFPERLTISTVRDTDGRVTGYVRVFEDLTDRKLSEEKLHRLTDYDHLTGLPNRQLFGALLHQGLEQCERLGIGAAVFHLDIDSFSQVNHSLGHTGGDALIQAVARRLKALTRPQEVLARIAGDEFAFVIPRVADEAALASHVARIQQAFDEPFVVVGQLVTATVSVGASRYPTDGHTPDELQRNASAAVQKAKDAGRNTYAIYAAEMTSAATEHVFLEHAMRAGLQRGEFRLAYQPLFAGVGGRVVALEALLRWTHPERGFISPGVFIPVAESCGLIRELGAWVLREACTQGQAWRHRELDFDRIAVNVSATQLRHPRFVDEVLETLHETGFPARCLELEVTETSMMEGGAATIARMQRLAEVGIRFAIDDFGTGYSSLAYLKKLPIRTLKIDRSFVNDVTDDADDRAIAEAVIALAKALRLEVVAEGVETEAQRRYLVRQGCDILQGFLLARPQFPEDVEDYMVPEDPFTRDETVMTVGQLWTED